MADTDSRYNVTISLDIADATSGDLTPFSQTINRSYDLSYERMQELQVTAISALLQALSGLGNAEADAIKAKRDEVKAPGFNETKAPGPDDKFAR